MKTLKKTESIPKKSNDLSEMISECPIPQQNSSSRISQPATAQNPYLPVQQEQSHANREIRDVPFFLFTVYSNSTSFHPRYPFFPSNLILYHIHPHHHKLSQSPTHFHYVHVTDTRLLGNSLSHSRMQSLLEKLPLLCPHRQVRRSRLPEISSCHLHNSRGSLQNCSNNSQKFSLLVLWIILIC